MDKFYDCRYKEVKVRPFLSVVIANYNYGCFLEGAIQSILSQGMGDKVEIIICDAASTDNSVEIIKRYVGNLPPNTERDSAVHLSPTPTSISWWCSEKDKGQSDAFNKGFSHARGRFGCWLNADDIMMPNALNSVLSYIEKHPKTEWLAGSSVFADGDLRVKWCSRCVNTPNVLNKIFPWYGINGPSSFFLLNKLAKVGGFDLSLRYTMDTDLWRRFVQDGMKLHHVKNYLWCFRVHEKSKTSHVFTEHRRHQDMSTEGRRMNMRYGITYRKARIADVMNRIARLISGAYLHSYVDTKLYKGKDVLSVARRWNRASDI